MTILSARTAFFLSTFVLAGSIAAGCSGRDKPEGTPNDGVGEGGGSGYGTSAGAAGSGDAGTTVGTTAGTTAGATAGTTVGSSSGTTAGTTAGTTSGSTTNGSTSGSTTGGSTTGGSTAGGDTFLSNTPGARFEGPSPQGVALRLVSSNFFDRPSGDAYFEQWLGEVVNDGSVTECNLFGSLVALDVSGVQLAGVQAVVVGPAYKRGTDSDADPCLAPGERGVIWGNAFADRRVDLSAIHTMRWSFVGSPAADAVRHPATPQIDEPTLGVNPRWGHQTLSGTLVASKDIDGVAVYAFGFGAEGLIADMGFERNATPIFARGRWPFVVQFHGTMAGITSVVGFTDFNERGSSAGALAAGNAASPNESSHDLAAHRAYAREAAALKARQTLAGR